MCISCAQTTHNDHEWDHITALAWNHRIETPKLCRKLLQENMPKCRDKIRGMSEKAVEKAMERKKKEDLKQLEERRTAIISMVNRTIDQQKQKRSELAGKVRAKMEKERRALPKKLDDLETIMKRLNINISEFKDYELIEKEQDMLKILEDVESYDVDISASAVKFLPGELNQELVEKLVGAIDETGMINVEENFIEGDDSVFKRDSK